MGKMGKSGGVNGDCKGGEKKVQGRREGQGRIEDGRRITD